MKYYVFLPYLIVTLVFAFVMIFSFLRYKKILRTMEKEVGKSEILCELIELQAKFDSICESNIIDAYPLIKESLIDIPRIVKSVGWKIELDKIHVVPVSIDPGYLKKTIELIKEKERAPEEIQELLERKLLLVNKMVRVKHPWAFYWNRVVSLLKTSYLISAIRILCYIFAFYDKYISRKNEPKKYIVDTYPYIHCS